eukprot:4712141-Amphidinium_carterae.1
MIAWSNLAGLRGGCISSLQRDVSLLEEGAFFPSIGAATCWRSIQKVRYFLSLLDLPQNFHVRLAGADRLEQAKLKSVLAKFQTQHLGNSADRQLSSVKHTVLLSKNAKDTELLQSLPTHAEWQAGVEEAMLHLYTLGGHVGGCTGRHHYVAHSCNKRSMSLPLYHHHRSAIEQQSD